MITVTPMPGKYKKFLVPNLHVSTFTYLQRRGFNSSPTPVDLLQVRADVKGHGISLGLISCTIPSSLRRHFIHASL